MSEYRLIEPVGRGAFGVVWRAEAVGSDGFVRQVALKVLEPRAMGAGAEKRFRDEARILGRLRHRAIVRVENLTQVDGRWAIVAEYVDGADLGQVILAGMPPRVALEVCEEVAGALHEAWSHVDEQTGRALKLVHRDVKPGNIRLTRHGEVRLLDFGIARADFEGRESDTTRGRMGTPRYMAPERADALDGPEGDVYALGLVLAEAIAAHKGDPPPKHPERHATFLADRLERVRAAFPDAGVAAPVVELVGRMLAYEHAERPSAREVELAARDLAARVGGPSLRQWAETAVPGLPRRPLTEELSSEPEPPGASPTADVAIERAPRMGLAALALGGALVSLALATVSCAGALALVLARPSEPVPVAAGAPVAAPVAEAPELPAAEVPQQAPSTPPAPPPRPATPPRPEPPAPVAPTPEPTPEPPPPRTSVRVTGAHAVTLVRDGSSVRVPGGTEAEVEPGRWQVFAEFAPGDAGQAQKDLEVGATPVELRCAAALRICRRQP